MGNYHVAEWLNHLFSNPKVMGSNPALGTLGKVSENQLLGSTHAMRGKLDTRLSYSRA